MSNLIQTVPEMVTPINLGTDIGTTVNVQQYTSASSFAITIDGFTIPDETVVYFYAKKPSGFEIFYECEITGSNQVKVACTLQLTAEVGDTNCQIQIVTEGTHTHSFDFILKISENVYAAYQVETANDYRVLDDLLESSQYVVEKVYAQEQKRIENENIRKANETARIAAESARVTAEQARVEAEGDNTKGRVKAENDRVTAEAARATAETGRDSKESERQAAETARVNAETARASEFSGWQAKIDACSDINDKVNTIKDAVVDGGGFVPLDETWIVRGTYNSATKTYTDGCKMEYKNNSLVISFI